MTPKELINLYKTSVKNSPKRALEVLAKKKKMQYAWDSHDLMKKSHTKSFMVAKAMSADVLQDIYEAIVDAKKTGKTIKDFKKELIPKLQSKGWWGRKEMLNPKTGKMEKVQLGSEGRLRIILETNLQTSYARGRYDSMKKLSKRKPYWLYKQLDRPTKNKEHKKFDNKVFISSDPIWNKIYPPSWYGCKCSVTALSEKMVERMGLKISNGKDFNKYVDDNKEAFGINPVEDWKPPKKNRNKQLEKKLNEATKPPNKKSSANNSVSKNSKFNWTTNADKVDKLFKEKMEYIKNRYGENANVDPEILKKAVMIEVSAKESYGMLWNKNFEKIYFKIQPYWDDDQRVWEWIKKEVKRRVGKVNFEKLNARYGEKIAKNIIDIDKKK